MRYRSAQANAILDYARDRYGTEPEFPWADAPAHGILRHRENARWYGVLLVVPACRLGLPGEDEVEILDIKLDPVMVGSLRDDRAFFPAYHMNKEHWLTVLLNGAADTPTILALLDRSYALTARRAGAGTKP